MKELKEILKTLPADEPVEVRSYGKHGSSPATVLEFEEKVTLEK